MQNLHCYRQLKDAKRLERSIGTLGGGNHFIEIDIDDDNNKSQFSRLPVGAEILWYRYDFGAPSADERCGVYWTFVDNTN